MHTQAAEQKYQGYTNAATYLAALYLANDFGAYTDLHKARQADGTIKADDVKNIFIRHGLRVDNWVCEYDNTKRPQVNWTEVAEDFAAKND